MQPYKPIEPVLPSHTAPRTQGELKMFNTKRSYHADSPAKARGQASEDSGDSQEPAESGVRRSRRASLRNYDKVLREKNAAEGVEKMLWNEIQKIGFAARAFASFKTRDVLSK